VPKLRHSSKTVCPNSVKKNRGCSQIYAIERPGKIKKIEGHPFSKQFILAGQVLATKISKILEG
jgi:hypothetical protein